MIKFTVIKKKIGTWQSQSRKDRGCLSLISNMEMQFLAIWAALKKLPKKSNYELVFSCFHDLKNNLNFFKAIVASALKSC